MNSALHELRNEVECRWEEVHLKTEKKKLSAAPNRWSGVDIFLVTTPTHSYTKNPATQNKEAEQGGCGGVKPPEEDAAPEAFINFTDNSCFKPQLGHVTHI